MRKALRITFGVILAGIAAASGTTAISNLSNTYDGPGAYAALAAMTGIGAFFLLRRQ